MTQLSFADLNRGTGGRRCRFLKPTSLTGTPVEGLVILGSCTQGKGTVYDRDCDLCAMWEAVA